MHKSYRMRDYAISKIKQQSFVAETNTQAGWSTTRRRLDYYFCVSILFLVSSFVFYSVVTYLISGSTGFYFAELDRYGNIAEALIDNIMYLQMLLGTALVIWYTYGMDD